MRHHPSSPSGRAPLAALLIAAAVLASGPAKAEEAAAAEEAVAARVEALKTALFAAQAADGSWTYQNYPVGMTALAVFALKHAGVPDDDAHLVRGVSYILRKSDRRVYSESLVICALELLGPELHRTRIASAASFLAGAQATNGAWSYGAGANGGDNSNTQFAVLGLAAAERCGVKVLANVKARALDYWLRARNREGAWGYQPNDFTTLSMTCAGIASLHLLGRVHEKPAGSCGEYVHDTSIEKALQAMGKLLNAGDSNWQSYARYAVERVGMFLDLKEIEGVDWYRWGADSILRQGVPGSVDAVALDLLFLARGEAQIAIAKWKWPGDWNRDHADLKRWTETVGEELGMKLDWVPADLDDPASPVSKASLVFVSGHGPFSAGPGAVRSLKRFLGRKGTVVAEACCGSDEFLESFKTFVREKLFPGSPVRFLPIGPGHPACRQAHSISPEDVGGFEVKTGCQRRRIIILKRDISCALTGEAGAADDEGRALKVASNLLRWSLASRAARSKLAAVPAEDEADAGEAPGEGEGAAPAGAARRLRLPFGRLVHRGEWNVDLGFFPTLAGTLASRPDLPRFDGETFVSPGSEDLFACPLVLITGHSDPALQKAEWLSLRSYIESGGTVVASACCGMEEFDAGFRRLLEKVLPNDRLEEIPPGDDLWKAPYPRDGIPAAETRACAEKYGGKAPPLLGIRREGRWVVIYSPVDLCCDLEGDLDEDIPARKRDAAIPIWADILKAVFRP